MRLEDVFLDKVLGGVYLACGGSVNSHPPEPAIYSKLSIRKGTAEAAHIPKALKLLKKKGLIIPKPTSGEMTWSITKKGITHLETVYKKKASEVDERLKRRMQYIPD